MQAFRKSESILGNNRQALIADFADDKKVIPAAGLCTPSTIINTATTAQQQHPIASFCYVPWSAELYVVARSNTLLSLPIVSRQRPALRPSISSRVSAD